MRQLADALPLVATGAALGAHTHPFVNAQSYPNPLGAWDPNTDPALMASRPGFLGDFNQPATLEDAGEMTCTAEST